MACPPDEEQRHSAPDIDGGLNGLGMYGGLSFIVEAAARHAGGARDRDLGNRVDAYLVLFRRLLEDDGHRRDDLAAVEAARRRPLPAFIPTNYLWVNPEATVTDFPVVEIATGRVVKVPTANVMTVMAVKRTVPTPRGTPSRRRPRPRSPRCSSGTASPSRRSRRLGRSLRRPAGWSASRRSSTRSTAATRGGRSSPAAGSPRSSCRRAACGFRSRGEAAVRAALVLEPAAMYGLYQYPTYRALVVADGTLPVLRVVR